MKIEIIETFIGFPEGVEKPEKTFIAGAVVDVGEEFGKAMIEKGHAKLAGPAKHTPSKAEEVHEAK